ncbi:MAG: hypothetical protein ACLF0G_02590 [Candidatus Brocadiia bacterium]
MSARGPLAGLLAAILATGWLSAGEAPQPEKPQKPAQEGAAEPQKAPQEEAQPEETPQQRRERLGKLYDRAEALRREGALREAQKLYAQIALEEPNFRRVAERLRAIRIQLRDDDRAKRQAEIDRLLEAADAHFQAADFQAAAQAAEAVLAIDPHNARAQRRLAECAGELELRRRIHTIVADAHLPAQQELIAQADTALDQGEPDQGPPSDAAPAVRTGDEIDAEPPQATRIVEPGQNIEVVEAPKAASPEARRRPPEAEVEGAALLAKAWDLYQTAKVADDPRAHLRQAMDTLSPITPVSDHSQHTKDTAAMLRKSIARRLASGGAALSPEEAQKARLYQRYMEARQHFRKKDYDAAIAITEEILAEDKSFSLARHLNQEARLQKQELARSEQALENRITVERRFAEVEVASVPPDAPTPVGRPAFDPTRPTYEVASPQLEEKLNQRISVNLIDADLDYVLDLLFRSTGVNIIYNPTVVEGMTITIHVQHFPLRQLLDYIASNQGLVFTTTEDGVLITTPDQPRLETFVHPLHYGLVDVEIAPPAAAAEGQGGASPPIDPPDSSNLEKLVEALPTLVEWPQGSFTYLDRKMNILYVRTTREAYQEVARLLDPIDKIPQQVLIKTLFVEVDADEFETFGVQGTLSRRLNFGHIGDVRYEISPGSILNFPGEQLPGETAPEAGTEFTLTGFLTEPQFELVIDALQRTGRSRTLAAPNVICMNNCTAKISVTKDLIYVDDYEVDRSDISGTTYGNPYYNPYQQQQQQQQQFPGNYLPLSSEPIIVPVFAEGEDTGFTLDVAPSIGKDNRFITLTLNPRIREEIPPRLSFELVFPSYRTAAQQDGDGDDEEQAEPTTAVVERPIIGERAISTKLTVADGSIVALGGLIQQKKIRVRSKVPILSDIPIIGKLIGRKTFRDRKTLLIIFVQAEILTPTGARCVDSGNVDLSAPPVPGMSTVDIEEETAPAVRSGAQP